MQSGWALDPWPTIPQRLCAGLVQHELGRRHRPTHATPGKRLTAKPAVDNETERLHLDTLDRGAHT